MKARITDKASPSYGKMVTVLRKQMHRYLVEFIKDGKSYWMTRDKLEIL